MQTDTTKSYQDLKDGLWYFHIKALNDKGAWGGTTHYMVRIDTTPPASFKPKANYLSNDSINKALVTFFTTDALSGIDHYEIAVIDENQSETASPIFVRSESPYQVPAGSLNNSLVMVRAFDSAGNTLDTKVTVKPPSRFAAWLNDHSSIVLVSILVLFVLLYLIHYLWGHHILRRIQLVSRLIRGKKKESVKQVLKDVKEIQKDR